jgi:pimeloyl-ACP methyl ester carboxylesterase
VCENQLAHFSSKYKVVAIDLAGFGDSGNARDDWTMEAFGYDVSSVLDKLRLENAILVGFSMGVPVVIETAEIRPGKVSGIVLVDFLQNIETVYSDEDISNSDRALMELVTEPSVEKSEPFFVKNKTELAKRYVSLIKDASRIGWRESLKNIWLWCNYECADSLKNVQSQVVSINADQNPTNEEAFRKYVPSFRAKIIEGIGHFVPWEAPDEFNRLLEESIRELVETTKNQQL